MFKKWSKKISTSLLTLAMVIGMIGLTPVAAAEPVVDLDKNYAIVTVDGKAIMMKTTGYMGPSATDAKCPHADGKVSSKNTIDAMGIFKIEKNADDYYSFYCPAANNNYLELEGDGVSLFSWSTKNPDGSARNHAQFALEEADGGYYLVSRQASEGHKYLSVEADGLVKGTAKADATVFTFKEVEIIDNSLSIENVGTKKYVTTKDQELLKSIKVTADNVTDTEKFDVSYQTNDNHIIEGMDGQKINTVSFISKANNKCVIGSANWQDGAVSAIMAVGQTGGWESIVVAPNGDGTVSLRSAYTYQYVTVNDQNELALCDKKDNELTDKEKFIIHTGNSDINKVEGLVSKSRPTNSTISFTWGNATKDIISGYEIWRSTTGNFADYKKVADVSTNSYTDKELNASTTYYYKVRAVNGQGSLLEDNKINGEFSDVLELTTLQGEAPKAPKNLTIKDAGDNKATISWDKSESSNVVKYEVYKAVSAYAPFEKVGETDALSYTVTYTTGNDGTKYHYYKVVAVSNEDVASELDDIDSASLEKELFGKNVIFIAETDDFEKVNEVIQNIFSQQNSLKDDAQFNGKNYSIYYKPGDYTETDSVPVGFYTHVGGLGKVPTDVKLNNMEVPAYLDERGNANAGNYWDDGGNNGAWRNATCNFWRSAENLSIVGTGKSSVTAHDGIEGKVAPYSNNWSADKFSWSVAQAAPLRRVYSTRDVTYDWSYGWASGGYTADCLFEGDAKTDSGQQYFTRNSVVKGNAIGTTLNNFNMGVVSDSLPTTNELINGNGYSNWGVAGENNAQQVTTNILQTPTVKEKPFLFLDDDGEYKIFVPALRTNSSGVSWGNGKANDGMGEGEILSLDNFYITKEGDSAATINEQLASGKNIFFTPGVYHAEEVIEVNNPNTIVLGSGMATIIPENSEGAMKVADVDGIILSGLIFDAGKNSEYLLTVGEEGKHVDHSQNPTLLQDLFFRVGGTTNELTKAKNALIINSDDVIGDHFWIWRADHGAGVAWDGNESDHGLIVNGDDVNCYALFNEHFQNYHTLWNGENGATYFYQNETAYDPISQEAWMSHNGTVNGYSSYKVANNVDKHYAVGLGIYNVFINTGENYDAMDVQIQLDNAIEVPNKEGVYVENACIQTFAKSEGVLQKINSIVNGKGYSVSSGTDKTTGEVGDGWARQFLLSYNNGTAVVGKKFTNNNEKGKFTGTITFENVNGLGDDNLDLEGLKALVDKAEALVKDEYTEDSWTNSKIEEFLQDAKDVLANKNDYLKYAFADEVNHVQGVEGLSDVKAFNDVKADLDEAILKLVKKSNTPDEEKPSDDDNKPSTPVDDNNKPSTPSDDNNKPSTPVDDGNGKPTTKPTDDIDSNVLGDEVDTTIKTNNQSVLTGTNTNNVKTSDSTLLMPYVILAVCAAGVYITIKKNENA